MPTLRLDGDASGAIKAVADLNRAIGTTGKEAEKTGTSFAKLEAAAAKIVRDNEGPQGRYNNKIKELATLVDSGALSLEQAGIAAKRYGEQLDRALNKGKETFGATALSELRGYATGLLGIHTIIEGIRKQWESVREEQLKVTEAQMGAVESRDVLKRNIFGLPDAQRAGILAQADQIARASKLPQKVIDQAIAQTVSSRSGNAKEAAEFVAFATRFTRDRESIGEFSGALGDIANALGTNDPQQALGFLGITAQRGRPTNLHAVATNLPKMTQAVRGAGGDPRFGGALFAGLTVGAADTEGRISRTAGIQLTNKLGKFFAGNSHGFQPDQVDEFNEQIQALFNNPKLAREFLAKNKFQAPAQPAVTSLLLDKNSAARQSFESTFAALGTAAEQRAAGLRGVEFLSGGKLAATRRREETVESAMEDMRMQGNADFSDERRNEIRELTRRVRGTPALLHNLSFGMRTGPTLSLGEAVSELEGSLGAQAPVGMGGDPQAISAAQSLLEELRGLQQDQLRELQNINNKTRAIVPSGRQE